MFRAVAYLLTHGEEAAAARRALVDWVELVDLLRKRAPKTARKLNKVTAAEMLKKFKGYALENAVFATGRAVRSTSRPRKAAKPGMDAKRKSPIASFLAAFGLSYGLRCCTEAVALQPSGTSLATSQ